MMIVNLLNELYYIFPVDWYYGLISEYTNIQDLIIFLRDLENYQMNEHEQLKFDIKFDIKFEC